MSWRQYRRTNVAEMRPFQVGESLHGVSISEEDMLNGSPRPGDMIARNPKNPHDLWLVAEAYFKQNFEPMED
jgi:hypothetical protein